MAKRRTSKRELIDTGRNKIFGKRDPQGRFKEMDDVRRSLQPIAGERPKKLKATGRERSGRRSSYTAHTGKE